MSNNVQSHETVVERVAGEERRLELRHRAGSLGSVNARIIGGSPVDLVNFSSRGVLFECDSRLLIGARASVRITTTDANLIVTGRVVRSRVKGLVNGALRYDAALVLDNDLTLTPAIIAQAPMDASVDAELAELDATFDASPVEAYLAESEASLAEVAGVFEPGPDAAAMDTAGPELAPPAAAAIPAAAEAVAGPIEAADDEPIAFEPDGDVAFEPAVEFAFDEAVAFEPVGAIELAPAIDASPEPPVDEPAGSSMFDATYVVPAEEPAAGAAFFESTAPTSAADASSSTPFDSQPSESYDSGVEPVETAGALDAAPGNGDGEIAFEAADGVQFEAAFDEATPVDGPAALSDIAAELAAEPVPALEAIVAEAPSPLPEPEPAAVEADAAPLAPAADIEDRVLLQFAATVPHDLAELRRIAAGNQW